MSEFGEFDIRLSGTGSTRVDLLSFTVTGATVGTYFAAHVAGFDIGGETSAFFAGSTNEVPIPPAMWLLGSGLIGLVGVARRRT
jgi:hypothetical protein